MKNTPSKEYPLPWNLAHDGWCDPAHFSFEDQGYIVHAANAYPKLVTALKDARDALSDLGLGPTLAWDNAVELLRELGETE